ncbi:MAG: DNA gyrase subunit A [Patescibacteria group bacterium]
MAKNPTPIEPEEIVRTARTEVASITAEMEKSYLDYAMSVIVSRALPDVRDGLKPVQRRIIYAMHQTGLDSGARFSKSAAVVGETMKRYHPHGDMAIYDALVRMAQDFTMRYQLVTGQGNFGSVDGDSPAAMRYTECRLSPIAREIISDIEKETVNLILNYSGTDSEPDVMPSSIPNLLLNGASGIAVGMATSIPPHNLGELVDALSFMVEKGKLTPEKPNNGVVRAKFDATVTVEELMQFVQGPDFPTGGTIYDKNEILASYSTGRGSIIMRAKAKIEEIRGGKSAIIVTELPYQVNKAELVARIADLVREHRIEGISDLRDESDRQGLRVVVELKRDARPQQILNLLYKHTEMQRSFHVNFVALVNSEPRTMTLKNALEEFLRHRQEIIIRRTIYLLRRAKEREHILLGLKIALDHLDEVIKTIRASKDTEEAKINLIKKFKLSEIQALAILEMPLKRLAALERKKIEDELKEIIASIKNHEMLLASPVKVLAEVKKELVDIKAKYADERKTKVIKGKIGEFSDEDLITEEDVILTLTESGYIKRMPLSTYRTQGRGGKGVMGATLKEGDTIERLWITNTHDTLFVFTDKGKVFSLRSWDVPEASRQAKGTAIVNLIDINQSERILTMVPISKNTEVAHLFMTTKLGTVKKTSLDEFGNIRRTGIIAIKIPAEDSLCWVKTTSGKEDIIITTSQGKSIRFHEKDVRSMGRNAAGVRGIKLRKDDFVLGMDVVSASKEDNQSLLTVSENGFGKRTKISAFRKQSRGGSGIICTKVTKKTGNLVASRIIGKEVSDLLLTSNEGQVIRMALKDVPSVGRATQGVRLMRLDKNDKVAAFTCLEETPGS